MMEYLDIVFDGPPGPVSGRFVGVEKPNGVSMSAGVWLEDELIDGRWRLRIKPNIFWDEPTGNAGVDATISKWAQTWSCDNYMPPLTCLTAPSTETGRCDQCQARAEGETTEDRLRGLVRECQIDMNRQREIGSIKDLRRADEGRESLKTYVDFVRSARSETAGSE